MPKQQACSDSRSVLLQAFMARSGRVELQTPERVIESLIEELRRKRVPSKDEQVQLFLRDRKIKNVELSTEIGCDGLIEPLGDSYSEGFQIRLRKTSSHVRQRFTLAHEACHTFFYEMVPEIKFGPHREDEEEEKLCNFGAAALLIPAKTLIGKAKKLPPCLDTLQLLASHFDVSLPTMFLRLRNLDLWKLELSIWDRMSNGNFAITRLYGGRRVDWEWSGSEAIESACGRRASVFGSSFLNCRDASGTTRFRPVNFELRHQADGLIALWGEGLLRPEDGKPRLFGRVPPVSSRRG